MDLIELRSRLEIGSYDDDRLEVTCRLFAIAHGLPIPFTSSQAASVSSDIPMYLLKIEDAYRWITTLFPNGNVNTQVDFGNPRMMPQAIVCTGANGKCHSGVARTLPVAIIVAGLTALIEKDMITS